MKKQDLLEDVLNWVAYFGECECDDGKSCVFCKALILKGAHADWEFGYNSSTRKYDVHKRKGTKREKENAK